MNVGDITEKTLVSSKLFTNEELKFARVYLRLSTAGKTTRNWFKALSKRNFKRLSESVDDKIQQLLRTEG